VPPSSSPAKDIYEQGYIPLNNVTRLDFPGDGCELAANQNEDACSYGKERQDNCQAAHRDERRQARQDQPYG